MNHETYLSGKLQRDKGYNLILAEATLRLFEVWVRNKVPFKCVQTTSACLKLIRNSMLSNEGESESKYYTLISLC